MNLIRILFIMLLLMSTMYAKTVNGTLSKIKSVEYKINGTTYTQNKKGQSPLLDAKGNHIPVPHNTNVYVTKVTLTDLTILDNFANDLSIKLTTKYLTLGKDKNGVPMNGIILNHDRVNPTNSTATQAFNSTNLKNYLTYDDEDSMIEVLDLKYNGYYITNKDYIFFHERNGNNSFKLQALDKNHQPTGDIVVFPATKGKTNGWDPGFEIGGPTNYGPKQHPWMGAIKASQFHVPGGKIYGLKEWAKGADLKFYAGGTEPFVKPTLSIADQSIEEGDNGIKQLKFTVHLDKKPGNNPVKFYYEVYNGDTAYAPPFVATDKDDFIAKSNLSPLGTTMPMFPPVELKGDKQDYEISVDIKGDKIEEDNENFRVKISHISGTSDNSDKIAHGTIIDNDGLNTDFGDAPEQYTHVSHKISSNLYLGDSVPDGEEDQQSSTHATGDGLDDNDAVVGELPKITLGDTSYTVPVKVFNKTGKDAYITAWIDFNRNATFEYNEAINTSNLIVHSSNNTQTVNVTWDNTKNDTKAIEDITVGKTIMRLRLTTSRVLRCDDEHYKENPNKVQEDYLVSPDGEVEDYEIQIKDTGDPFVCENMGRVFNSPWNGNYTSVTIFDLNQNKIVQTINKFADRHINATGYNVQDDFIYGMGAKTENQKSVLIKIDKNYVTENITIDGLPDQDYYVGDIDNEGIYYVSNNLRSNKELQRINLKTRKLLAPLKVHFEDISANYFGAADFAFNPVDNKLYYVDGNTRQLTSIDPKTGHMHEWGNVNLPGVELYSVIAFFDKKGNYYFNNSSANKMYKIDISNPKNINPQAVEYAKDFQFSRSGDGAKCANAGRSEKDYGDALDSYPHVGHEIYPNLYLGDHAPDEEEDQNSTVDATGDGEDDNDGVMTLSPIVLDSTSYSVPVKVYNKMGKDAYITAWIDFNRNGKFEANEALSNKDLTVPSKSTMQGATIEWNNAALLKGLTLGENIMRIRISTTKIAADEMDTFSPDGEIEDYLIHVVENGKYGRFNIERTNSGSFPIMTDERNAWYTQIVGRDFDYSLVFYTKDFSAEQNISNVTVKVDLMDMDKNESIYDYSFHIPTPANKVEKSRITILTKDDLNKLPATRNARFKVTYGVTNKGSLIQEDCLTTPALCSEHRSDYAKDNFAIRPDNFYMTINDKSQVLISSQDAPNPNTPSSINLAAGYQYGLTAIATEYMSVKPAKGYKQTFIKEYDLNTSGICASHEPLAHTINFVDGNHTAPFSHDNVGRFIVGLLDNSWTNVDKNGTVLGCVENNASRVPDAQGKVGCDINLYLNDMEVNFQPDHFAVDLNLENLPASGHSDFIYMMELNTTQDNVAIAFNGNITALSAKDTNTTNFTAGCVAKDILFDLDTTTVSVDEAHQQAQTDGQITTIAGTPVNFSRVIQFNNDPDKKHLNYNNSIPSISAILPIDADKFLNENNGSVNLNMRFNLNKNIREFINPVTVTFHNMEVNSTDAASHAHEVANFIPTGNTLVNRSKDFYYARVASKFDVYPEINRNINSLQRTPLQVDFFCLTTAAHYCEDRHVFIHSDQAATSRDQNGWYYSNQHNGDLDGHVISLTPNPAIIDISANGNDVTGKDTVIKLNNGSNGTVTSNFKSAGKTTVTVTSTPVLTTKPAAYIESATDINASEWTGVGKTGHVLEIKPQVNSSKKMSW